jgi:hypothetical protein
MPDQGNANLFLSHVIKELGIKNYELQHFRVSEFQSCKLKH